MSKTRLEGRKSKVAPRMRAEVDEGRTSDQASGALDVDTHGPKAREASLLDRQEAFDAVVTRGVSMQPVVRKIANAARSASPVMLIGEPGTGKRAIARLVHELSPRVDMPFVRIDCEAITARDFEAELLGFKRFAFEGATRDREGLLHAAHRGTLLLENVGSIADSLQAQLHEILDTGVYHRLGDRWNPRHVDVRIVATRSTLIPPLMETGALQRSLYDHLSVISLELPSLRARIDDVQALLEHFARAFSGRRAIVFDAAALSVLTRYSWPGNLRELQNAVECGVVLGNRERIRVADLPVSIQRFADSISINPAPQREPSAPSVDSLDTIERRCIVEAMRKTGADRLEVGRLLGMTQRTLAYRVAIHDLEAELAALESAVRGADPRGIRRLARVRSAAAQLCASGM